MNCGIGVVEIVGETEKKLEKCYIHNIFTTNPKWQVFKLEPI